MRAGERESMSWRRGDMDSDNYLSNPALAQLRVFLAAHAAALRGAWRDKDRGASAVELAVITAIILAVALALLLVIRNFVKSESAKIHG